MTVHPLLRSGDLPRSTGLAIAQRPDKGEPGDNDFSFRVHASGVVEDLGGWGFAGSLPNFGNMINVPPNPLTIHTVAVDDDGPDTRKGLRKIIDEHVKRFGETQVYVGVGVGHDIVNWARIGCPAELAEDVPTDAELRDMNTTDILGRDDRQFDESQPNPELGETDLGAIPGALEVEKQVVAQSREAAGSAHPTVQATTAPARATAAKEKAQRRAQEAQGPQEPPPAESVDEAPAATEGKGTTEK